MIFGNSFLAKSDVALSAHKRSVFLFLIDLKIKSAAIISRDCDVASIRPAARTHGNPQRLEIQRIEGRTRDVVTTRAIQVRMLATFMAESAGGNAATPFAEHRRVGPHGGCQLRIEINFQRLRRPQLVTDVAIGRRRRNSGIGAVTREANRVTVGRGLERAFLQPESIADILWRLGHEFLARIPLRLISLMTDRTTLGRSVLLLFLHRRVNEPPETICSPTWCVKTDDIDVLVVRKSYAKFRNKGSALKFWIGDVAQAGKQPATRVTRAVRDVTVRANRRRGSFTRKELLAMTIQTGSVLGKVADVRKGRVTLANFFPILCGDLVT